MYEYLLPIGSIVKVKNVEQRMMIYGVLQKGKTKPVRQFDYVAVPYPEGMHNIILNVGFNQADVEEVVFRGYEDEQRNVFMQVLETIAPQIAAADAQHGASGLS